MKTTPDAASLESAVQLVDWLAASGVVFTYHLFNLSTLAQRTPADLALFALSFVAYGALCARCWPSSPARATRAHIKALFDQFVATFAVQMVLMLAVFGNYGQLTRANLLKDHLASCRERTAGELAAGEAAPPPPGAAKAAALTPDAGGYDGYFRSEDADAVAAGFAGAVARAWDVHGVWQADEGARDEGARDGLDDDLDDDLDGDLDAGFEPAAAREAARRLSLRDPVGASAMRHR